MYQSNRNIYTPWCIPQAFYWLMCPGGRIDVGVWHLKSYGKVRGILKSCLEVMVKLEDIKKHCSCAMMWLQKRTWRALCCVLRLTY